MLIHILKSDDATCCFYLYVTVSPQLQNHTYACSLCGDCVFLCFFLFCKSFIFFFNSLPLLFKGVISNFEQQVRNSLPTLRNAERRYTLWYRVFLNVCCRRKRNAMLWKVRGHLRERTSCFNDHPLTNFFLARVMSLPLIFCEETFSH